MKVLAVTIDGKLTYCTKGRCDHIAHQNNNESGEEFVKRVAKDLLKQASDNYKEEILNLNWSEKLEMINNHENLDVLVDDDDWHVRKAVAEQGYGLDRLVNDLDHEVRASVAKQNYGLDKLVDDEDFFVRKTVAEQGYGLDKLANDKNPAIREIARKLLGKKKINLQKVNVFNIEN